MSNNTKSVAIVLGGTVPHCELIRQLQKRGYYTILVDYLPDSPAKSVADEHIQESTLDQEMVLKIARERNASLVIAGCIDQANVTAVYVSEKLGLYVPYDYQTSLNVTNKGLMKRIMVENNIPTSRHVYVDERDDLSVLDGLRYPLMVKPADSNSANGVKKVSDPSELEKNLKLALSFSRNHKAVVEEFVTGKEISAYCYVKDHKAKLIMTAQRLSVFDGEDKVIKCFSTIAPAAISKKAEQESERIATLIAQSFGLDNTPLFVQAIVQGDEVDVLEFAPRVGGGSCFMTIKGNTGFDIIEAVINSWLNVDVNFETWHYPEKIYVVNTVYGKDGVFDHFTGGEELVKNGVAEEFFPIKMRGAEIDNSRASSSRLCFFITAAPDYKGILEKADKAYSMIHATSSTGEEMIRRELGLDKMWDQLKKDQQV